MGTHQVLDGATELAVGVVACGVHLEHVEQVSAQLSELLLNRVETFVDVVVAQRLEPTPQRRR